jgi:hypothetical protein
MECLSEKYYQDLESLPERYRVDPKVRQSHEIGTKLSGFIPSCLGAFARRIMFLCET